MSVTPTDEYQKLLANIASLYIGLGQSVIPIYGDKVPERAKVSAVNWKIFQMRFAPEFIIEHWFLREQFGGLAIVTGHLSKLVVIDFDSAEREAEFRERFSYLCDTRIIRSAGRGLSHYYYNIPHGVSLPTLHSDGADLLSNGAYVIAPPTIIDGKEYTIVQGGQGYQLTQQDANRLLGFFKQECNGRYTQSSPVKHNLIAPPQPEATPVIETPAHPNTITPESLVHLYQHYAPQIGRNNALFKVACHGRDHQLSQLDVRNVLRSVHANQLSTSEQQESHESRLREADKTIASAFSQAPKPLTSYGEGIQLTNSIREALLKRGLTCVARVLDGLFLKGFKQGDVVTKKMVTDVLNGEVGRHSVIKTFSTELADNQPIFQPIDPPPTTPSHTSVAIDRLKESNNKCVLFSTTESDKTAGGRIPAHFCIPDLNVLCNLLDVPFTRSDPLTLDDIQQAKIYRQAMHRELIKRRPGMYFRDWLANRLGVSKRTSQRYDSGAGVQRQAMYIREPITWDNVDIIPLDEPIDGRFLEGNGKRYPPLRQIAIRLLSQKQTVNYCYQDANYYWHGDNLPIVTVRFGFNPKQAEYDAQLERLNANLRGYWADFHAKKHVKDTLSSNPQIRRKQAIINQIEPFESFSYPAEEPYQPKSKRFYKQPLPDSRAEYLAKRLYQAVWDKATTEKSRISLANARQLIDEYNEPLIHRALGVLKSRRNINNPAGFVVVWLRSTARGLGMS